MIKPMLIQAPLGVDFDFNYGVRLHVSPYYGDSIRKVKVYDGVSDPYEAEFTKDGLYVNSAKCWFLNYKIELYENDNLIYQYDFNCKDKNVLILMDGGIGDTISWIPYIDKFRQIHGCNIILSMNKNLFSLFESTYPQLKIVDKDLANSEWMNTMGLYAVYTMAYKSIDNMDSQRTFLPDGIDRRKINIAKIAPYILGLDPEETIKARINILSPNVRPIKEKYICIGAQASAGFKYWANPTGWLDVIKHLTARGYRVVCIDQTMVFGDGKPPYDHYPDGLEDQTGDRPLTERARWLAHCDLFVGLGSGLSWLAWAVGVPVVMIAGFSDPITEFNNPYRIINRDVCNSCWNDPAFTLDHSDWYWCPRHKGTPRMFECSIKISSDQVIETIDKALLDQKPQLDPKL